MLPMRMQMGLPMISCDADLLSIYGSFGVHTYASLDSRCNIASMYSLARLVSSHVLCIHKPCLQPDLSHVKLVKSRKHNAKVSSY
jgi:hypothetical protein